MQCCNKHVIIHSGARVSELIRAIRSFISIDLHNILLFIIYRLRYFVKLFSSIDSIGLIS